MSTFFSRAKSRVAAAPAATAASHASTAAPGARKGFSFAGATSPMDMGIPDFGSTPDDYDYDAPPPEHAEPTLDVNMAAPPAGIPTVRPTQTLAPQSAPAGTPTDSASAAGGIPMPSKQRFSFGGASLNPQQRAQAAAKLEAPDELVGLLTDVRLYNDWGIGKVTDDAGRRYSVKGAALTGLEMGNRYKFEGKKTQHPKFGAQFEIVRAHPDIESIEAIVAHITRNYKGAGQQTATKLARHHRDNGTLEALKQALIHEPSSIDFAPFSERAITLRDDDDSKVRRVRDSLSIRLGGLGVGQNVIAGLAGHLVMEAAIQANKDKFPDKDLVSLCNLLLDDNPYSPIHAVERYGFKTADLVARQVGIDRDDPKRVAAAAFYALKEACESGSHTWLSEGAFHDAIQRIDYQINPAQAIKTAIDEGAPIVVDTDFGTPRYYTAELRKAEMQLAHHLSMRLTQEVDPLYDGDPAELPEIIKQAAKAVGLRKGKKDYKLDESQVQALIGIMTSTCSLHTLTAGPGCGKTTIVEVMMEALGDQGLRTTFCAPTGKAAKVLNGRVRRWGQAKTIHSTLEFNGEWKRNSSNPVEADFIVGDEQSMLGTGLGYRFFDAVPANAHVLMLGDPKQLDPIDAGNVLKAVLNLEGLDHHTLSETHRNDGDLLDVINEVGDGFCDAVSRPGVQFVGQLPEPSDRVFAHLAQEVSEAAQKYGGLARVGVICPKRKGNTSTPDWNVTYLNAVLRDAINPDNEATTKKIPGTSFRLDDRILITKNMWIEEARAPAATAKRAVSPEMQALMDDLGAEFGDEDDNPFADDLPPARGAEKEAREAYVVNGDTGNIVGVEYDPAERNYQKIQHLVLQLDDDRTVHFPGAELESLALAYAITVHAAQGSEYGKVFAIDTDGHESFMYRSMLFTQFSRSQSELKVYGDPDVLAKVAARPAPVRNCALVEQTLRRAGQMMGDHVLPEAAPRHREVA